MPRLRVNDSKSLMRVAQTYGRVVWATSGQCHDGIVQTFFKRAGPSAPEPIMSWTPASWRERRWMDVPALEE